MKQRIIDELEKVRPALQRDGGDVRFVSFDGEGVVKVELQGACAGCPGATFTLKNVIEEYLKKEISEVTAVVAT